MNNDEQIDIPEFLKISQARRKAAWHVFVPRPSQATTSIERWRIYEAQRRNEAKEKARVRIEQLRAQKGQESFYDRV